MSKSHLAAFAAVLSLIAGPSVAQDAATHDMECIAAMAEPGKSPDEKTRWGAAGVAAYYLGRLDERGLTLEQINSGVEKIVLSPDSHAKVQQRDFTGLCLRDMNARVRGLKALADSDVAKMGGVPPR